ncbi:hypothetical protein Pfo_018532 [Paulownia fortunei]|nr:hypothetical protein Pfo_018532 [Paulownia fortunei]
MGDSKGHFTNGLAFCILGLWHLFNHIKLHAINPKSYTSFPWFPTSRITHLELFFIMAASSISCTMELFTGSLRHQPLDPDGSISPTHLPHFEHSIIALVFFVYSFFAFLLSKLTPPLPQHRGLTNLLGGVAFAVELLLFHLHAADHMGLEGHYHWLLQVVIFTSLATTLLSIKYSKSFLISFVRSLSFFFQGVWLINIGFMLWTPGLIPKGCFMNMEDGHYVVRCHGEQALERAKSLANIQFSYYVVGLTALARGVKIPFGKADRLKVLRFKNTAVAPSAIRNPQTPKPPPLPATKQMDFMTEWKSLWPISSNFSAPLLIPNKNPKTPFGPLIFTPDPNSSTTLLHSPSLSPHLPPPYLHLSLSRVLQKYNCVPSSASSISSLLGPQFSSCSSYFNGFNSLQLLQIPNKNLIVVFFPTGENFDHVGFSLLYVKDGVLSVYSQRESFFQLVKEGNVNRQRITHLLVNPIDDFCGDENAEDKFGDVKSMSLVSENNRVINKKLQVLLTDKLGSFWDNEFSLFCYGPAGNENGSVSSKISKFCNSYYAWGCPSELSMSGCDCKCGSCLVREELFKASLPVWIDWRQKKHLIWGFGILEPDFSAQLSSLDSFGGFILIRLTSAGKLWESENFSEGGQKRKNIYFGG